MSGCDEQGFIEGYGLGVKLVSFEDVRKEKVK